MPVLQVLHRLVLGRAGPGSDYSTELTIGHYRATDHKPSAHLGDSEDRLPTEFDPLEW